MEERPTGQVFQLDQFRKAKPPAALTSAPASASPPLPPVEEGTIPLNIDMAHQHIDELVRSIKEGLGLLKTLDISTRDFLEIGKEQDPLHTQFCQVCPARLSDSLSRPIRKVTAEQVELKERLTGNLEQLAAKVCASIPLAAERKRLQRAVEVLRMALEAGPIRIADGARPDKHLRDAVDFAVDIIGKLDDCGVHLGTAGIDIGQSRLSEASDALKKVASTVTILNSIRRGVRDGLLIAG